MARFTSRLLIALLTFTLGLLLHIPFRKSHQRPEVVEVTTPKPTSNTFEGTGIIDMFKEDYRRDSDGAIVRYGCYERASPAAALGLVRNGSDARIIEKTDVVDATGVKIGERVVRKSHPPSPAEIEWNEGARLFHITALSLKDARAFEKSKVWVCGGCMDARSW